MSRYITKDARGYEELNHTRVVKDVAFLVLGLVALMIFNSMWFTIDQTQMGNVRRMGVRLYDQPIGPGLHFKLPFVDSVDRIRTTLNTIHVDPFVVSTNDNQQVTLAINYNYTIPANQVNHLLYEVGSSGSEGIHDQAIAVVRDRASWVFAGQNMVSVNSNRNAIQTAIESAVHQRLHDLFGIEPHSLQISAIEPSKAFMLSNEAAVNAKNAAVAAENQKRTIQFQADQVVIAAKGKADAAIESARGDAEAVKLQAEAEKFRQIEESKGTVARVQAFGSSAAYVDFIRAQAWKGEVPQYMGGNTPVPFLNISK
jgi:regulator of protease activity HflC (stomatin/prohibitin superfamily)